MEPMDEDHERGRSSVKRRHEDSAVATPVSKPSQVRFSVGSKVLGRGPRVAPAVIVNHQHGFKEPTSLRSKLSQHYSKAAEHANSGKLELCIEQLDKAEDCASKAGLFETTI